MELPDLNKLVDQLAAESGNPNADSDFGAPQGTADSSAPVRSRSEALKLLASILRRINLRLCALEMDSEGRGSDEADFKQDIQELEKLIDPTALTQEEQFEQYMAELRASARERRKAESVQKTEKSANT